MSNVARQQWDKLQAAFSGTFSETDHKKASGCTCLSKAKLQELEDIPECASIHTLDGETLWISQKALWVYCKQPGELKGKGLATFLSELCNVDLKSVLKRSLHSDTGLVKKVSVQSEHFNSELLLNCARLSECGGQICSQKVVVTSHPIMRKETRLIGEANSKKQMVDLLEMVKSICGEVASASEEKIELLPIDDSVSLPKVTTNEALLGKQLSAMLKGILTHGDSHHRIVVRMQRVARKIKVCFISMPNSHLRLHPDSDFFDRNSSTPLYQSPALAKQFNDALGTDMKFRQGPDGSCLHELIVPINAGVALPSPDNETANIVRIHKPANENVDANPIPKARQTG